MKCPVCKAELYIKEQLPLETLSEHVCDPDGIVSNKNAYSCSNVNCYSHSCDCVWNSDGEIYYYFLSSLKTLDFFNVLLYIILLTINIKNMITNEKIFEKGVELASWPCDINEEDERESNGGVEAIYEYMGKTYSIIQSFTGGYPYFPDDEAIEIALPE